jgi:hypothetical protein
VIIVVPEHRIIDDQLREAVKDQQKEIEEQHAAAIEAVREAHAQPAGGVPAPALDGHVRNLRV